MNSGSAATFSGGRAMPIVPVSGACHSAGVAMVQELLAGPSNRVKVRSVSAARPPRRRGAGGDWRHPGTLR